MSESQQQVTPVQEETTQEQPVEQSAGQEQTEQQQPELPTYPLSPNLRQALREYLGARSFNEVANLVDGLNQDQVPGQVIIDISQLLQQERPVRLMQGLQMNVQQVNQARAQQIAAKQQRKAARQAEGQETGQEAGEQAEEEKPQEVPQQLQGQVPPAVEQQGPRVNQAAQGQRVPPQLLQRLRQQRQQQQ